MGILLGMKTYAYTVRIEPAEEGGFNVFVPALPGCVTQGATYAEAVAMAQEAIHAFLESLIEDGDPVPEEAEPADLMTTGTQVAVPVTL